MESTVLSSNGHEHDEGNCQLADVDRLSRGSLQMLMTGAADLLRLPVLLVTGVDRVEFASDACREFRMQTALYDGVSESNNFYLCKQRQSDDDSCFQTLRHSILRLKRFEQSQIGSGTQYVTVINAYEVLVPGRLLEDRDDNRLIPSEAIGMDKSCSKEALWNAIQAAESRMLTQQVEQNADWINTWTCDCAAFCKDKQLLGYTNNRKFATISDNRQQMQLSVATYGWLLGGLRRTHTIATLCESTVHTEAVTRQPVVLRVRLTCLTEPIKRRLSDSLTPVSTPNKSFNATSKRIGNMRFADETGEIKATVFEEELDAAYAVLAPGGIYAIVAPRVQLMRKRQFTSCTSRFDLLIGRETRIVSLTSDPFLFYLLPVATFNFTPFDVLASVCCGQHVDVVGFITRIQVEAADIHFQSATSLLASAPDLRVKFFLEDETGHQILVTLFDQLAASFNDIFRRWNSTACNEPDSGKHLIIALRDVRLWRASVCGAAACSVKSTSSSTAYFRADLIGSRFTELRRYFSSAEHAHKRRHTAEYECSLAGNELLNEHSSCDYLPSTPSKVSSGLNASPRTSLRDVNVPLDSPVAKRSRLTADSDGDADSGLPPTPSALSLDVHSTYNYYHYKVETPREVTPSRSLISLVLNWLALPFRILFGSESPRGAPLSMENCQTERLFRCAPIRNGVLTRPDVETAITRCNNVGELLARARCITSAMQRRDEETLMLSDQLFEVAFRIESFIVRTVDSAIDLVHLFVTDAGPDNSTAAKSTASILCDGFVAHALFGVAQLLAPNAAEFIRLAEANCDAGRIFRCVVFPVHRRSSGSFAFVANEVAGTDKLC